MIRRVFSAVMLCTLLATMAATPLTSSAAARSPEEVPATLPPFTAKFFPETQHNAMNSFYETWRRTPNALFVLGYPISEPFIEESFSEPGTFYRVQYFERGILEEHPENAGTQYYILGRLMGNKLISGRENEEGFRAVGNPGDGTWDNQTSHTLRNEPAPFRSFYQNNGGLSVFGRPKSEQFQELNQATGETYWVQYFERQRMEWHPNEQDPKFRILLGLLGNEYRDANQQGNNAFAPTGAATPATPPSSPSGPRVSSMNYGFNAILYGQGSSWQNRGLALNLTKEAGVDWLRQQIRWQDLQSAPGTPCHAICWGELDAIVNDASNAGVKLLFSVVKAPTWATGNGQNGMPNRDHYDDFAEFMGAMAARYAGRVQAYEIWNEQNLAWENGGRVASAGNYVDMLVMASKAIKAGDSSALVLSGGPSATETNRADIAISDLTFYRQMFNDPRFRDAVDVIGAHPGGASNPPDTMWPDYPGPGPQFITSREFYFRRIEDVRSIQVESGLGDKPVWITEFGWATKNNTPGYEYGNNLSQQKQAEYIVRAFEKGRTEYQPWLQGMFLWQLNFAPRWKVEGRNEFHEQASFGVLNSDWTPRPAYAAIKAMPK